MRVFVNERPVDVPAGSTVQGAVAVADPALADRLGHGAYATDGRGIQVDPGAILSAGAILRVITPARRADADA